MCCQRSQFLGLDSLRGAIDLEDVKILEAVPEGLRASVKTTIRNRTCLNIEHVTLKSADVWYKSTKVLYISDIGSISFTKNIGFKVGYQKDQVSSTLFSGN